MTRPRRLQSARARTLHRLAWLVPLLAATACGAEPPQAPFHDAKVLDSATSGIAFACGEAYQVTAFPGDHTRALAPIRRVAATSAHKLATVAARGPNWIYQGQTITEIATVGAGDLRACGLDDAARLLARHVSH